MGEAVGVLLEADEVTEATAGKSTARVLKEPMDSPGERVVCPSNVEAAVRRAVVALRERNHTIAGVLKLTAR